VQEQVAHDDRRARVAGDLDAEVRVVVAGKVDEGDAIGHGPRSGNLLDAGHAVERFGTGPPPSAHRVHLRRGHDVARPRERRLAVRRIDVGADAVDVRVDDHVDVVGGQARVAQRAQPRAEAGRVVERQPRVDEDVGRSGGDEQRRRPHPQGEVIGHERGTQPRRAGQERRGGLVLREDELEPGIGEPHDVDAAQVPTHGGDLRRVGGGRPVGSVLAATFLDLAPQRRVAPGGRLARLRARTGELAAAHGALAPHGFLGDALLLAVDHDRLADRLLVDRLVLRLRRVVHGRGLPGATGPETAAGRLDP
jgi:hypothetical protein